MQERFSKLYPMELRVVSLFFWGGEAKRRSRPLALRVFMRLCCQLDISLHGALFVHSFIVLLVVELIKFDGQTSSINIKKKKSQFGISQVAIWDVLNCDLGYTKFQFGMSQIAIWDNVPNRDLGQSSIWATTISQIEMRIWDVRNRSVDLGYLIGFGLQQRYYNSSKLSNSSTMQIVYFEVEIIDKENMGTYSFLCLHRINTFNICK